MLSVHSTRVEISSQYLLFYNIVSCKLLQCYIYFHCLNFRLTLTRSFSYSLVLGVQYVCVRCCRRIVILFWPLECILFVYSLRYPVFSSFLNFKYIYAKDWHSPNSKSISNCIYSVCVISNFLTLIWNLHCVKGASPHFPACNGW